MCGAGVRSDAPNAQSMHICRQGRQAGKCRWHDGKNRCFSGLLRPLAFFTFYARAAESAARAAVKSSGSEQVKASVQKEVQAAGSSA